MGSMTWQFKHCENFQNMLEKIHSQQEVSANAKKSDAKAPEWKGPTMATYQQYLNYAIHFGNWCKAAYGCRYYSDCRCHVQDYADWLIAQKEADSTVHDYLSGVCAAFGISLAEIKHPIRHTADNTRSRGSKKSDTRRDTKRECSPRLFDLTACIGIRRSEYQRLCGDDLVRDETGYLCVRVEKGKGGKEQYQRVPPGREAFVSGYFDGSHNYVFTRAEMKNKIDLHHLRHYAAWSAYQGYVERLNAQPGYREQLISEVKARWREYCKKPWNPREVRGVYRLRGRNNELAAAAGFPVVYDRLALMATSIFFLSHWRNDVSVVNYLLAAADLVLSEKAKD